jgi:glycosyltransferase involved in cell wall biosynthesis
MRVMHVVVAGDIGGAERLLVDLATRPEHTGADHEIALFTPNPALVEYLRRSDVRVHARGRAAENPLAFLVRALGSADLDWLVALLREHGTDIVHTHTLGSHVLGTRAARTARLPQVRTEHHVMHYFDPTSAPFTRWAARHTDRFVAISDYVRSVLAATAPARASRFAVIRNGIDTAYWNPRPNERGTFRLGIVCRLTPWKRVGLAIRAVSLARAELVVVGDGEQRRALEALARRLDARAIFVGHVGDPRPLVADCDATLSTADREPLGLSVLESLSMARPVIAFAGGGIPEIVEHETTGLLVRESTPKAFAAAIERARNNRAWLQGLGENARRYVVEHARIERMCEGYRTVYEEMLRA